MSDKPGIRFRYRNYKGEISDRRVMPMVGKDALTFGSTFHHVAGWNLHGWDVDKNAKRSFRLTDILAWLDDDGNPIHPPDANLATENAALRARVAELEARCKLLELAGDNLDLSIACGCGVDGPCQMCRRASDSWKQTKEAKP